MATAALSMSVSATRARANMANALATNAISGYSPLPAGTEDPSTFIVNGISGTFGDTATIGNFIMDDGMVYTLISCKGAEVMR